MINTKNLTRKYGNFTALDNLNLSINEGEIYCLLGANGAGKTTTINLLLNFIAPTSGTASINGIDVEKYPRKTKAFLTYIPENLMLYPSLTAVENLDYFSGIGSIKASKQHLEFYLTEAGLQKDALNRRVKNFSKGMRQKVGIALAIAQEAKVLLLDEPTSGLDPQASNEFVLLLKKMSANGTAILMATHDLFRAKDVATHIGIMSRGTLQHQFESKNISLKALEYKYLEIANPKAAAL